MNNDPSDDQVVSKQAKRTYNSPLRADQAQATRARIRDAAGELFLARGYAGVSMIAVAEAAGVSRQTVFSGFGSKAGLLRDVIHSRIAGSGAPVTLAEGFESLRLEPDPRRVLRLNASLLAEIHQRTAAMDEVLAEAASADPEAQALQQEVHAWWLDGMGQLVELVAARGALAAGRDKSRAREGLWLVAGARPYLLARALGWSLDEYAQWLSDCSIAVLLDEPTRDAGFNHARASSPDSADIDSGGQS